MNTEKFSEWGKKDEIKKGLDVTGNKEKKSFFSGYYRSYSGNSTFDCTVDFYWKYIN